MRSTLLQSIVTSAAAFLTIACASVTTAPADPPAATVRIREWSAAYYGSATTGKGTLNYNGQRYRFGISGLGAGGIGGQQVSASGRVYGLNNLADFPGTYRGISQGLTLIEGTMHARLTNQNGVVIYLAGETEGLASSIGVQEFKVSLLD